jgi:hypothetical protein
VEPRKPLEARTMLELLDRTFRIYRDSFVTFITATALVTVPVSVISILSSLDYFNRAGRFSSASLANSRNNTAALSQAMNGYFGSLIGVTIVGLVLAYIQGVVLHSVLTYMASERNLGRSITVGGAFSAVRGRLGTLSAGLAIFYGLVAVIVVALTFTLCLCGLGIGPAVYFGLTLYAFLIPVLVLERTTVGAGMNRAWALAKARFWPVFGFTAAVTIITSVIYVALNFTVIFGANQTIGAASLSAGQILRLVLTSIVSIFIAPILPIGYTLLYYDTRVRVEGLDIALQNVGTPEPRPADVASPPLSTPFLSGTDVKNIGILIAVCLIPVVLYFVGVFLLVGNTSRGGF